MQVKLSTVINAQAGLKKILTKELPIKVSFRLSKLALSLEAELQNFNTARSKLFEKYGERKEDDIIIPKEKTGDFNTELEELLDVDIKLDYDPILVSDLGDIKLSAADLMSVNEFLKE